MSNNSSRDNIYVTKTLLPPIEEYEQYLRQIWSCNQLTNQGPLLRQFEDEAKRYLGLDEFQFVANGTLALQLALKALDITEGEVITTPFSYVATTSAILWERCKPVFVDIDPITFCIDADMIEAAITTDTKAILAVHVFGNPCEVEKIKHIADAHNLKVIYDAAHAFGVQHKGASLLRYGDISTGSFHATKVMQTIEGGCIIAKNPEVSRKVDLIKRFGHDGDEHYMLGTNAKASEFQAAMGLCSLAHLDENIGKREAIFKLYKSLLSDMYQIMRVADDTVHNYGYFPVVCKDEASLMAIITKLGEYNIFPRRYFYPSLNKLSYITNARSCPISEDIASRVMCLPLYVGLEEKDIRLICEVLNT